jgi:DNA polymerase III subunit delta
MTPAQALREAESGSLRPVYLVLGEELYLQRQVLRAIREAALRGGIPGLNEDQVLAQNAKVSQVLGFAKTLPMMSQRRWIEVRQVEHWEGKEGKDDNQRVSQDFDALAAYAETPMPSSVLVLAGEKLNTRRKLVTIAKKQGFLVECEPLSAREIPDWVRERVEQRAAKISRGCAELLAELIGTDLSQLDDAIERLVLFVGNRDRGVHLRGEDENRLGTDRRTGQARRGRHARRVARRVRPFRRWSPAFGTDRLVHATTGPLPSRAGHRDGPG